MSHSSFHIRDQTIMHVRGQLNSRQTGATSTTDCPAPWPGREMNNIVYPGGSNTATRREAVADGTGTSHARKGKSVRMVNTSVCVRPTHSWHVRDRLVCRFSPSGEQGCLPTCQKATVPERVLSPHGSWKIGRHSCGQSAAVFTKLAFEFAAK